MNNFFKNLKIFLREKFEIFSGLFFFIGFALDYFGLPSVLSKVSLYIGFSYFIIIGLLIFVREFFVSNNISKNIIIKYKAFFDISIAILLGSFTSFSMVYYLRGGDIIVNLPILSIILILMFANEFLRKKYRIVTELIAYSISTIFFFIFAIPIILKGVGDREFAIAMIFSFVYLYLYLRLMYSLNKENNKSSKRDSGLKIKLHNYIILPILLLCVAFYFKLIPAVPLNLHYINFYKNIYSYNEGGKKYYEYEWKINRGFNFKRVVSLRDLGGDKIYFYTEIEAPIDFVFRATHKWEYYNESKKVWETVNEVTYDVNGGREGGYRGYTFINNLKKGEYKVSVLINGNRYIGSARIYVIE